MGVLRRDYISVDPDTGPGEEIAERSKFLVLGAAPAGLLLPDLRRRPGDDLVAEAPRGDGELEIAGSQGNAALLVELAEEGEREGQEAEAARPEAGGGAGEESGERRGGGGSHFHRSGGNDERHNKTTGAVCSGGRVEEVHAIREGPPSYRSFSKSLYTGSGVENPTWLSNGPRCTCMGAKSDVIKQ